MLALDPRRTTQWRTIEVSSLHPVLPDAAEDLWHSGISLLEQGRLFRFEGIDVAPEPHQLGVLYDSLTERIVPTGVLPDPAGAVVDVFCRPGVTDAEGETATLALAYAGCPGVTCKAGARYRFAAPVDPSRRTRVEWALGNALIQYFQWNDALNASPHVERNGREQPPVARVNLQGCSNHDLREISRRHNLALDPGEMRAVARYFEAKERPPTDVELQSVALAWSEHCGHKTFKARIELECEGQIEIIPGLLSCITEPTTLLERHWVRSAFVDNAGVIAFDDRWDLAVKVETHNHPSALEPFGGAHTGVGGVIRDVLAVSAEPIANTDVLCFGPLDLPLTDVPAGALHPRATIRGVTRGVADYGNNMGIPTVAGAVLFHPGFVTNPLVYCGTLGIAPRDSHPREPQPGDAVVLLGGRTGRDGLHGATMSSEMLDRDSAAGSTVQIGAPITEKILRDVLPRLRDERLYHAITDCGAGGLCSAVGEMGSVIGVEVDLAMVSLKYEGLQPWEIWLSEAQERMVLAVPRCNLSHLYATCAVHDLEATTIGQFRDDGRLVLRYSGDTVADLEMAFLHRGCPERVLRARWTAPPAIPARVGLTCNAAETLLALLSHPNIASKEEVIRRYDHEVGAATVGKPLVGNNGPADAAILQPLPDSPRGVVVTHGINPLYGMLDPYAMARLVVDEALRNLIAVGGRLEGAALLDNFCWGDVDDLDELGSLARAAQGCRDAALTAGVPFVSGKDSLRNTSVDATGKHSIPGTLLITAVGVIPDVAQTVSMDLKRKDSAIYLLGSTGDEMGGSHYLQVLDGSGGRVPTVRPQTPQIMRCLSEAIAQGLVLSCHDLSEGGLAVAAAEMALAGGIGLDLDLQRVPTEPAGVSTSARLFAESPGRWLLEIAPEHCREVERLFQTFPCSAIGETAPEQRLVVHEEGETAIDLSIEDLELAWKGYVSPLSAAVVTVGTENRAALIPTPLSRRRAVVLTAAGINCDRETIEACRLAGFEAEAVHVNQLLRGERSLHDFAFLVLPGGFSYGDHLGAGAMLATVLRHRLMDDVRRFVADGRPLLGVCNGFQVLTRLELLDGASLVQNISGRFECRWVNLRVETSPCLFLRGLEALRLPVAHGQGRVILDDCSTAQAPLHYVENPNGSMHDIAGLCNAEGNVFGLMPHPERYLHRHQYPTWQRDPHLPPYGLALFRNAAAWVKAL